MEPIPETRQALEALGDAGREVLRELVEHAALVREIVPSCVGITLATMRDGMAFTLVATSADAAQIDGVQYAAGGPCVSASETGRVTQHHEGDALDEETWRLFSAASAEGRIASTLTLPILVGDRVAGTVNLYASGAHAFAGHHHALAEVFGAWAAGAVANADLTFASRTSARRTRGRLEEQAAVDQAIGVLMEALGVGADGAREALTAAAERAGIDEVELAHRLIRAAQYRD